MSLNFILNCLSFSARSGTYVADLRCSTGREKAEWTVTAIMLEDAIPVGAVSRDRLWPCWMSISLMVLTR